MIRLSATNSKFSMVKSIQLKQQNMAGLEMQDRGSDLTQIWRHLLAQLVSLLLVCAFIATQHSLRWSKITL